MSTSLQLVSRHNTRAMRLGSASGQRRLRLLSAAIACTLVVAGSLSPACGPDVVPDDGVNTSAAGESLDGHQRMRDELQRIAEWVMHDNRFLGDSELIDLQAELKQRGDADPARNRFRLHSQVSAHQLRLGRTDEALASLDAAARALQDMDIDERGRQEAALHFYRGLAWLRYAENVNCVACQNAESCLVPLQGAGLHEDRIGSTHAVEAFTAFLEHAHRDDDLVLTARWLLNIAAMTLGDWPDEVPLPHRIAPKNFLAGADFTRFPNVSADVGLDTLNLSGGVVLDDLDGDGFIDVLTSTWDYLGEMHLMHNNGDGTFTERTAEAGLTGFYGGLNMVHADVDSDGDPDVLVLRGAWFDDLGMHPNSLLLNDGNGSFTDVTFASGLGDKAYPTQGAAFADYDADGDLDLYLANEDTPRSYFPSQLFRNEGHGRFADVAGESGVANNRYGKAAAWGDIEGDGDPDLFVSNLFSANRLYRNDGEALFTDIAADAGTERPEMSFGAWFWDYDNDGDLDIYSAAYVEDMSQVAASWLELPHEHESGRLLRNDGAGRYEDVTSAAGLGRLVTTMGSNVGDLDNDGWLDFYLGTGFPSYTAVIPNVMYRNVRGERFEDVTAAGGFGHLQKGHGVAFADIDNDGDQDVFEQMGGAYTGDAFRDALYRNPGHGHHWLAVDLVGTISNRDGFGARVSAEIIDAGTRRSVHRQLPTTGSFGSNPLHLHLGLGAAERIERLVVRWPVSDTIQVFEAVAVDRTVQITEGDDVLRDLPRRTFQLGEG